jgi:hypothetical protein
MKPRASTSSPREATITWARTERLTCFSSYSCAAAVDQAFVGRSKKKHTLRKCLDGETSGNFKIALQAAMYSPFFFFEMVCVFLTLVFSGPIPRNGNLVDDVLFASSCFTKQVHSPHSHCCQGFGNQRHHAFAVLAASQSVAGVQHLRIFSSFCLVENSSRFKRLLPCIRASTESLSFS